MWHHNPARVSHFGGLFETAVGSLKRYIKRMPSISNFTYENFHTATCTWEAIQNILPLYPLVDNSHDFQVLTPAHSIFERSILPLRLANGYGKISRQSGSGLKPRSSKNISGPSSKMTTWVIFKSGTSESFPEGK